MRIAFSLILFILLITAPTPAAFAQDQGTTLLASVELPAPLERVLRDYEQAWKSGDAVALAALFTAGGFVHSDAGWIKGHEAIENKYQNAGGDLRLRAIDFAMNGDVAFIVGAYGYGENAATQDRGNFVLALRKSSSDRWLIVADLDKSNRQ